MSQNKLKSLKSDTFFYLTYLQILKLSANQIKFLNSSLDNLKSIRYLNFSSNNISNFNNSFENLEILDLSHNLYLRNLLISENLKSLYLSNTSANLILNLTFPKSFNLYSLDLSFNFLPNVRERYLENFINLYSLNLQNTSISNFDIIFYLKNTLFDLNLSDNEKFNIYIENSISDYIRILKVSKTNLTSFLTGYFFEYLDLSFNEIKSFISKNQLSFVHLDLKSNKIEEIKAHLSQNNYILLSGSELDNEFKDNYANLTYLDLSQCIYKGLVYQNFRFNKKLEMGKFSGNRFLLLPQFCQICFSSSCIKKEDINLECKLKELHFNLNNLEKIFYSDLSELNNLEYFNLEKNLISSLESNSFSNLIKLETLLLSSNRLTSFNAENAETFSYMSNLKLLNLSSNLIEIIPSFLFSNLLKLETLDLSLNLIHFISSYSFNNLISLRNLHINEQNGDYLKFESNETFHECDSIQTIYLSKSILQHSNTGKSNIEVLLNVFEVKKKQINKTVLNRPYFKSLFLISYYNDSKLYDCNLTLFFIRNNIHFNFKTETQIFDYFSQCFDLKIKDSIFLVEDSFSLIFSFNGEFAPSILAYFFWFYILFVLSIGFYWCVNRKTQSFFKL